MNNPAEPIPESQHPLEAIPPGMSHREYWKRFTQQTQDPDSAEMEVAPLHPPEPAAQAEPVLPAGHSAAVEPAPEAHQAAPAPHPAEVQQVEPAQLIQQTQLAQQTLLAQLALQAQLAQQAQIAQQAQLTQLTQQVQAKPVHQGEQTGMEIQAENETPRTAAQAKNAQAPARKSRFSLRSLKFGPPFWTITGMLSLIVNVILIAVLISLASQVFKLKSILEDQLLGGLYNNFVAMDDAHIRTSIPVNANVPAKFDLTLNQETTVILTKATMIKGAKVASLVSGGMSIYNAPADIVLPVGTELPVSLNLKVPVDQQIPVNLTVNVDIPLNQTDLHGPFTGLQKVVSPYYQMLKSAPNTLQEAVCGIKPSDLCASLIP